MKGKIPVEISTVKTPDGKEAIRPQIPLSNLLSDKSVSSKEFQDKLEKFSNDYLKLIKECKLILKKIEEDKDKNKGKVDSLLYWDIGDKILNFIQNTNKGEFFINRFADHITRDLEISRTSYKKILRFRKMFKNKNEIDVSKGWHYYRELSYKSISAE